MKQARVYTNNITYPNKFDNITLFRMNLDKTLFRINLNNKNRVLCLRVPFLTPTMFKSEEKLTPTMFKSGIKHPYYV